MLIHVETWAQAVPDAAGGGKQPGQSRGGQGQEGRACPSQPQKKKKAAIQNHPGSFLLLKSP